MQTKQKMKAILWINNVIKSVIFYILILLGLLFFILFFYVTFIRTRLPKEIPFELSEFRFWFLLYFCCLYIYIIKILLFLKVGNIIIQKIISYIGIPFRYFDNYMKKNSYTFPKYFKFFKYITPQFKSWTDMDSLFLIYVLHIFPRIILILIFIVDVFWLNNISIFYYFLLIGIFPLFYRYIKYSAELELEDFILELEKKYDQVWIEDAEFGTNPCWERNENAIYHNKVVTLREYIRIQYETILKYGKDEEYLEYIKYGKDNDFIEYTGRAEYIEIIQYRGDIFAKEEVYIQYKIDNNIYKETALTIEDYESIKALSNLLLPRVIELNFFVQGNKNIGNNTYISKINAFIYFLYLICWVFILVKSFHTLKDFDILLSILKILNKYQIFEDPFTGLLLLNCRI